MGPGPLSIYLSLWIRCVVQVVFDISEYPPQLPVGTVSSRTPPASAWTHFRIGISATLQRKSHLCIPFWELSGLSPSFHIHVSVSDLCIPRIGPHTYFPAAEYRQTDPGNI
jgi:hypothetical protein